VGSDAAKENAKLIAAAPELLAALQDAEKALFAALDNAFGEELANGNRELIQARAAIAKALGQQTLQERQDELNNRTDL